MPPPIPTSILRLVHIDNLPVCLARGGLYAPNNTPADGLIYRTIHNVNVQARRAEYQIPCGPGGVIHDYVAFYFGPLSPMMLQLTTGQVDGYYDGQDPLIYFVSTVQAVQAAGAGFAFSDGHGIKRITSWSNDLQRLDRIDWDTVGLRYWRDTIDDMDRQRRKQAEFLVHGFFDWALVDEIVVISEEIRARVDQILTNHPLGLRKPISIRRGWYYR